jgi:hypothetical protein
VRRSSATCRCSSDSARPIRSLGGGWWENGGQIWKKSMWHMILVWFYYGFTKSILDRCQLVVLMCDENCDFTIIVSHLMLIWPSFIYGFTMVLMWLFYFFFCYEHEGMRVGDVSMVFLRR